VQFRSPNIDERRISTYDSNSYPAFERMKEAVQDQAKLTAVSYTDRSDLTYSSDDEMEKAFTQFVSGDMFAILGLKPAFGRILAGSDDLKPGAHPVAVISYDYWAARFGRDPRVVGKTFRLGDGLYQDRRRVPRWIHWHRDRRFRRHLPPNDDEESNHAEKLEQLLVASFDSTAPRGFSGSGSGSAGGGLLHHPNGTRKIRDAHSDAKASAL